jgi:hypothetical protein
MTPLRFSCVVDEGESIGGGGVDSPSRHVGGDAEGSEVHFPFSGAKHRSEYISYLLSSRDSSSNIFYSASMYLSF